MVHLSDAGEAQEEANKDKGSSHKNFLASESIKGLSVHIYDTDRRCKSLLTLVPEARECVKDSAENSFKECKLRVEAKKEKHEEKDDAPDQNKITERHG